MAMLFYRHQISGEWHCDNTRIAGVRREKSPQLKMCFGKCLGLVFLHKPHRRLLMMNEGLERFSLFVGGDIYRTTSNSVLRGKEALKNKE